jgi:hypothetical protein
MLFIPNATTSNTLVENLLFFLITTSFLGLMGWNWRQSCPFRLPQSLPRWFSSWLVLVLFVGILVPVIAIVFGWFGLGNTNVLQAFLPYFLMLGLQILCETVTLRNFRSCIWVVIPCLYIPYRVWQLHTGIALVGAEANLLWVKRLLVIEIWFWMLNYGVHLYQIPRLLRWDTQSQLFQNQKVSTSG